jgi:hypothetical protein
VGPPASIRGSGVGLAVAVGLAVPLGDAVLVGVAVHSAGYWRVERDQMPTPQEAEEPGDTES